MGIGHAPLANASSLWCGKSLSPSADRSGAEWSRWISFGRPESLLACDNRRVWRNEAGDVCQGEPLAV